MESLSHRRATQPTQANHLRPRSRP